MGMHCPARLYILDSFMYLMAFSCQVGWGWRESHQHCDDDMHLTPFFPPKKWKRRERFEKNGREWRWNECVKANGGREKTECASITGSKDYSCHFHWILFSHSLFSSYIFFSFFFLLSPMGIHFRLYHSWLRWIYLLPWNILVYGRPITALYTVLHIRGFRQVHEMNMVMQFASRKWNGRSLLDIHKDIKRERNVEREKKWWRKWM